MAEPTVSYNGSGASAVAGRVAGRPVLEVPDWSPLQSPLAVKQASQHSRLKLFSGSANQVSRGPGSGHGAGLLATGPTSQISVM